MIAILEGLVSGGSGNAVIVSTHGVGYRVFTTPMTAQKLRENVGAVKVFTHLYSREDTQELYGFETEEERALFEVLITVSGVGPKTALAVMTVASAPVLRSAIAKGDYSLLTKVSGIGLKTAKKIVLELSEKMPVLPDDVGSAESDVIDALVALGYSQRQARDALRAVPEGAGGGLEEKIKEALKSLRF